MVTTDISKRKTFGPPEDISNYEMEAMAISLALNHYMDRIEANLTPQNKTIAMSGNSQAALHLLKKSTTTRPTLISQQTPTQTR